MAVLNFLGSGYDFLLRTLPLLGMLFVMKNQAMVTEQMSEGDKAQLEQAIVEIEKMGGEQGLWALVIASVAFGTMLLVSGIGYLKLKPGMGRRVGTTYAVLSLIFHASFAALVGMHFQIMLFFIWPALTLILLNTVFKDDFADIAH